MSCLQQALSRGGARLTQGEHCPAGGSRLALHGKSRGASIVENLKGGFGVP